MNEKDDIRLRFTLAGIKQLCRHLASHDHAPQQQLATLTTLQTLLASGSDAGTRASRCYADIHNHLQQQQETARQELCEQQALALRQALAKRDLTAIAAIYQPLSRSGFLEILQYALGMFTTAEQESLQQWMTLWLADARTRGEQASGYPDAIDFAAAGIDIRHYSAMSDMVRYLNTSGSHPSLPP